MRNLLSDYRVLLETYTHTRKVSSRLSNDFVRVLEKDDIDETVRRLGYFAG